MPWGNESGQGQRVATRYQSRGLCCCLTSRWSGPGRRGEIHYWVEALAAQLEAVRRRSPSELEAHLHVDCQAKVHMRRPSTASQMHLVFVPALLLGCSSCSGTKPDIGDGGLLSETPCAVPCFFGIEPGSTTLSNAQQALANAGICPNPENFDSRSEGGTTGFKCGLWVTVSGRSEGEGITTLGYSPSEPLTVGMVVEALGPPDAVAAIPSGLPEAPRSAMLLFYDRSLTRLLLPEQETRVYRLEAATLVERVVYFERSAFHSLRTGATPWAGFGEYPAGE